MLNIWYGEIKSKRFIETPNAWFDAAADAEWILGNMEKEILRDIDKADVISENLIISDIRGALPPTYISGGSKALIIAKNRPDKIVNATASGDNCAKWYLEIAKYQDITVRLSYLMRFPEPFEIRILNTGRVVTTWRDFCHEAITSKFKEEVDIDNL